MEYDPYSLGIPDNEEVKPCPFRKDKHCTFDGDLEFQFNWSGVFWCETRSKAILDTILREEDTS